MQSKPAFIIVFWLKKYFNRYSVLFSVCTNMLGSVNNWLDFHLYSFVWLKKVQCVEMHGKVSNDGKGG